MTPQLLEQTETAATLSVGGKTLTLPVVTGTEGETAIDIQKLRASTGMITLDPGFGNTGACRSAITFIDGERGILRYRGYDIAELAEKSTFLDVAWLLLYGELPTAGELRGFTRDVTEHTLLHENFRRFFDALSNHSTHYSRKIWRYSGSKSRAAACDPDSHITKIAWCGRRVRGPLAACSSGGKPA